MPFNLQTFQNFPPFYNYELIFQASKGHHFSWAADTADHIIRVDRNRIWMLLRETTDSFSVHDTANDPMNTCKTMSTHNHQKNWKTLISCHAFTQELKISIDVANCKYRKLFYSIIYSIRLLPTVRASLVIIWQRLQHQKEIYSVIVV